MKAKAAQFQNVVEDAWSDAQPRAQTWQTETVASELLISQVKDRGGRNRDETFSL
jgi:hypothetical protein